MYNTVKLLIFALVSLLVTVNHVQCQQAASVNPPAVNKPITMSGLTFLLAPREEQCFYEDMPTNTNLHIEFEVIRGGLLDINFKLYDPYNQVVREKLSFFNRADDNANKNDGIIDYTTRIQGIYRICFDNTMSRWTAKTVSFTVGDRKQANAQQHSDIAKLTHLGPIVDNVIAIADKLDKIEQTQHTMRVREQSHRDAIESSNSRIAYLSILETVVLLVLAFIQIRTIMNWFAEKKKIGRV